MQNNTILKKLLHAELDIFDIENSEASIQLLFFFFLQEYFYTIQNPV